MTCNILQYHASKIVNYLVQSCDLAVKLKKIPHCTQSSIVLVKKMLQMKKIMKYWYT